MRTVLLPAVLAAALFLVLPAARGDLPPGQKTTFADVANSIMSPVCPGKLLQDCPSAEGAQLRELVRRKILAGETKEQIVRYFVDVYGLEVLPSPPGEGFFLTAWLLPFAGVLSGFGVVFVLVRAWSRRHREAPAGGGAAEADTPGSAAGGGDPLEQRLRRELKEFGD